MGNVMCLFVWICPNQTVWFLVWSHEHEHKKPLTVTYYPYLYEYIVEMLRFFEYKFVCLFLQSSENRNQCSSHF